MGFTAVPVPSSPTPHPPPAPLPTHTHPHTLALQPTSRSDGLTVIANPPCPLFLKLQYSNIGKSNQLESTENTVITTRSHLMCAVRQCFEQVHHGHHFIFEHPSNASSWNDMCVSADSKGPRVAGICYRVNQGVWVNRYRG